MPRGKKSVEEVAGEATKVVEEIVDSVELPKAPTGLDIKKLVKAVKGRYTKKKASLARDIKTGADIKMSTDPADYIVSEDVEFWKPLTGIIGVPFGRIVQIAGQPNSGKSTTAMTFMKAAQHDGVLVALWDSEGKFSSKRFEKSIGGNPAIIPLCTSRNIVEGAQEVISIVKGVKEQNPKTKILIVWDSVGATLNTAEDEENEDYSKQPGVTAKQVSWAIRRFNQLIERYRDEKNGDYTIAVLCINQVYANIGSVGFKQKGGAELTYLSSIILELTRKKTLKRVRKGVKKQYGIVARANVVKNHLFDGEETIAELDLIVSADGISLFDESLMAREDIEWDDDEF
jgi:recombination protein RecA